MCVCVFNAVVMRRTALPWISKTTTLMWAPHTSWVTTPSWKTPLTSLTPWRWPESLQTTSHKPSAHMTRATESSLTGKRIMTEARFGLLSCLFSSLLMLTEWFTMKVTRQIREKRTHTSIKGVDIAQMYYKHECKQVCPGEGQKLQYKHYWGKTLHTSF